MAYTIQATPSTLSSIQGDLLYTVAYPDHTSDPVTYPNFKFVADVYVGATLVARLKKVPDPVTSIGIFNIGNIVRNYISTVFNPIASTLVAQKLGVGEFTLNVTLKFGEEYSYTTFPDLVTDSERTFFNNYNGRLFGVLTSLNGLSDKPLTTRPAAAPIACTANNSFIPYLPSNTDAFTITVVTYDYGNNEIVTDGVSIGPDSSYQLHIINCSKAGINQALPGIINDNVKYYTVQFNSGVTFRFDIACECVYDVFTIHFLNKYGGFESKDFTKVSRQTIDIQRKDFGKLPYTVSPSGVVSYKNDNNVYNESRSVYSSQFKEKMVLNSDFLTDGEYAWLQELVLSTMVYLEQDGYFFPVVITENNYEPKKSVNDELSNLTINIEFGEQLNAQYR